MSQACCAPCPLCHNPERVESYLCTRLGLLCVTIRTCHSTELFMNRELGLQWDPFCDTAWQEKKTFLIPSMRNLHVCLWLQGQKSKAKGQVKSVIWMSWVHNSIHPSNIGWMDECTQHSHIVLLTWPFVHDACRHCDIRGARHTLGCTNSNLGHKCISVAKILTEPLYEAWSWKSLLHIFCVVRLTFISI